MAQYAWRGPARRAGRERRCVFVSQSLPRAGSWMAGLDRTKTTIGVALLLVASAPGMCLAQAGSRAGTPAIAERPLGRLTLDGVSLQPDTRIASDGGREGQPGTAALSGEQLQALPLTGRNWENFALDTTPTASSEESEGAVGGARLRGGVEPAQIRVDDASVGLAFGSAGSGRVRGDSLLGAGTSEAAIRQVKTVSGGQETAAERAVGGRVEVETERGTTRLHGQAFAFSRGNLWGARNPFTQWVQETSAGTGSAVPVFTPEPYTPHDHELTWGAGIGGRVRHRQVFWFGCGTRAERSGCGDGAASRQLFCAALE
jgi:hypothetical protein